MTAEEREKSFNEAVMKDLFFTFDEDKNIIPCKDGMEWAYSFENKDRRVNETIIDNKIISTMFFGINMNYFGGAPLLLETMVFDGDKSIYCDRYPTWKAAEEGHEKAIQWVKDGCENDG